MGKKAKIPWGESDEYQQLVDAMAAARLAYFRTLGEPDADVWVPLVNPVFQGGPEWPTRPAWQRIRAGEQTLIASSGLTDPISEEEEPNIGFGVETVVATAEEVGYDLRASWLMDFAQMVAHYAAHDGQFSLRHAKYGLFLFGIPGVAETYQEFADEEGYVGFLFGIPIPGRDSTIELPAGQAVLLTAKLLTRPEYEYAAAAGPEGAQRLSDMFAKNDSHHLSSPRRPSVI